MIVGDNSTIVGNPPEMIISDCDSSNSILYENVTLPDGYIGSKFLYDGTTWSANPEYVEPPETNSP